MDDRSRTPATRLLLASAAGLFALTAAAGALDGLGLASGSLHAAAGTLGFLTVTDGAGGTGVADRPRR